MQIEIKSQGIAAFGRELLDNADVTSTVIAGGVALVLSYGLWKIGRAIHRANRAIRVKLESVEKKKTLSMAFEAAAPVAVDTVSQLTRHWQRVEHYSTGSIKLAGDAKHSHARAETLLDALDFEVASLLAEVASVSAYAAERTGRAPEAPARLAPRKTGPRRQAAA